MGGTGRKEKVCCRIELGVSSRDTEMAKLPDPLGSQTSAYKQEVESCSPAPRKQKK